MTNGRNHPEYQWLELRTEHFRIFYHDPLEPWAREAASILERSHRPLCQRLDVEPRRQTRVYLSDQDQIANGAAVGWDYFFAWIPSHATARSFAGGRTWFEEVLTHEYAHILVSEASRTWLSTLAFPFGFYPPRWVHEGIAQWVAEPWSVLRYDRTLAAAILDGSIDRNPPGVPGRIRLLQYARGHARIRWLADAYGDSTIRALIHPSGRLGLYTYRSSQRHALGTEAIGWTRNFRREMISFYGERFRRGESPDSLGAKLEIGITYPTHVVSGDDSLLFIVGQRRRGAGESSLFCKVGGQAPKRIVTGGVVGRPLPLGDGRIVFTRMHRTRHGSWVEDLAMWDPVTGKSRFLTNGERIAEPIRVAGGRIAALADSPYGMSLVHAPLPPTRGPGLFTPLLFWPRGWIVHSMAASPDRSRLVFSATEANARRGLWGASVGLVRADTIRLGPGTTEVRGTLWLDDERLAWTSHAAGISNLSTGSWHWGKRLGEMTARTGLGTGAELVGMRNDSLLVCDRTSRIDRPVRRIDPTRVPARTIGDPVYPFHAEAATAPVSLEPEVKGPYPYRAIDEIRPWGGIPLIGPQAGEPAIGLAGLWAEPLLHHVFGGYFYASAEQATDPDRGFFYLTTAYGPYIALYHSSMISARRLLRESILFERREVTGIAGLTPLQIASAPLLSGWADLYVETDSRRPRFGGRDLSTPAGQPRAYSVVRLGGGIGGLRIPPHGRSAIGPTEGWGATVRIHGGIKPQGGASRFLRCSIRGFRAERIDLPLPASGWFEVRFEAGSGGLPPQEFVGLDADPSHRFFPGWPGLEGTVYLRGWPRARAARYVLHTNMELRLHLLPDLGVRGPGIGIHGGALAPFLEAAHPWGGRSAVFFNERSRIAIGLEARFAARLGPFPIVPAVAWGRPLGRSGPHGSWSWRLTTALPFSMPHDPRAVLRTMLGGGLHEDSWGSAPMPDDP